MESPIVNSDQYLLSDSGVLMKIIDSIRHVIEPTLTAEYPYWMISFSGSWVAYSCHILMAQMFIPNPSNLPVVNHRDGNKFNWQITNLEWTTQQNNVLHAHSTGLIQKTTPIETVKSICELIDFGQTNKTITELLGIPKQTVSDIRCGKRHLQISKDYKFGEKF